MMVSSSHASIFFLLYSSALSSVLSFTPCPLLGPAFPPFTLDTNGKTVGGALQNLTKAFDTLVATNTGAHGDVSPNTTFSIALFSSDPGNAEDEPFFWQYHHTSPTLNQSLAGSHTASKKSIYRVGGLTEVFTIWSLLLTEDGDHVMDDPVTKYLPELAHDTRNQDAIEHVVWDDITVGQLASHMSGIARDCEQSNKVSLMIKLTCYEDCSKDIDLQNESVEAALPPLQNVQKPCCGNGPTCGSSGM